MKTSQIWNDTQGIFRVETVHSDYILDLYNRTLTRTPRDDDASDLRLDEQEIPLLELIECRVGSPLTLFIDIRKDGIETFRKTTPVVCIGTLG